MNKHKKNLICALLSVPIGVVIGITAGLFGQALHIAEEFRIEHYIYIVPLLGLSGVFILFLYKRFSPHSEQGLNYAIAYNMGAAGNDGKVAKNLNKYTQRLGKYPKAYALLKLISNITMLFFGASTGKEGSFAAFGASIGDYFARVTNTRKYSRILLITGVSAAVSGLFQTPLGGIFFALEFTAAGIMAYSALVPAAIASYLSFWFSKLCGFNAFSYSVNADLALTFKSVFAIIVCAVLFGIIGKAFALMLQKLHKFYNSKVKNRYLGIFIIGTAVAILMLFTHSGRYCGTGANMISLLFFNGEFKIYDFALKLVFTLICITIGFSGGEMMPLLTIGATLGATMSVLFGLPLELTAAMGCLAVYASATNTLVAPIFIGIEMFGTDAALYIAAACIIAYAINGNTSVYSMQGSIPDGIYSIIRRYSK